MQSAPPQVNVTHDAWQKLAQECAQGATHDSNERQPHSTCLPGTRVELLRSLKELADDGKRKIVWISGESGSGKSTVAHTLADTLRGEGKLVGTFFFSRKHTKRSTFDHVLITLAYQLGLQHPRAKEIIIKAISDDPALLSPEKSRHDLLEKLIIEPLRQLAAIWKGKSGMSLILDALDEGTTSSTRHISPFISLLVRLVKDSSLPIHNVIISSRPWLQISSVMRGPLVSPLLTAVQVEDFDSREDVTHFLRHSFDHIYNTRPVSLLHPQPWPSESDIVTLSECAHGRFIFAATIVRFIDHEHPHNRLQLVCHMLRGSTGSAGGDIDQLYSSIIDEIEPSTRAKGLQYLSLIINLAEPLPLAELDRFFSDHVHSYLVPFSALISVPAHDSPDLVQTFHTSFRDFLQNRERDEKTSIHRHLASSCFQTMKVLLKRDICGLGDPSLLHDEIPDFAQRRDSMPRALRYSCLYWLHHLQLALPDDKIREHLLDFLQQRVLFAIEAYAVLGELAHGVGALREARKLVLAWPGTSFVQRDEAAALLYDSWRLTLDFFDPISISALHIYESALPCSPAKSKIRHVYHDYLKREAAFTFEEGLDDEWSCVTRVIDTKTYIYGLALSDDASQVVANLSDSIRVWDTTTGVLVASLPHSHEIDPSLNSDIRHNGSLIVFKSYSTASHYVWRPSDGILASFPSGSKPRDIDRIALSCNGAILACLWIDHDCLCPCPKIKTFDVASKEQLSCFSLCPNIQSSLPFLRTLWRREVGHADKKDISNMHMEFSLQGDCLMVHFARYLLVFNPVDGEQLSRTKCNDADGSCTDLAFFGPYNRRIIHVSDIPQVVGVSQFSFSSVTKPRSGISALLPDKEFRLAPSKVLDAAVRSRRVCKVEMIKSVDRPTSPCLQPESIIYSGELVGMKFGDHTAGFCHRKRTTWLPRNKQCLSVVCDRTYIQLVDVAQAALRSPSLAPTTDSEPAPGYEVVARSARRDMEAYKSVDSDTYLILGTKSPGSAIRWEFSAGTDDSPRPAEFSPKSTYLAIAFRDNSSFNITQFQVWDLMLRTRVGIEYPQDCKLTYASPLEIRFSYDDSALALVLPSATGDIIAYYSLKGNILQLVASFSSPQPLMYRSWPSSIGSVTRDAIHFWAQLEANEGLSPYHLYRWSRDTLVIERLVCMPRQDFNFPPTISPRSTRIYYYATNGIGAMDRRSSSLPNENIQSGDGQDGLYQIDEDHNPDCSYDALSWSDLCMTTDGWLRKRKRRICWLPARYRPSSLSLHYYYMKLDIDGDNVTILDLDDDKRMTIRLLHTNIEYFV